MRVPVQLHLSLFTLLHGCCCRLVHSVGRAVIFWELEQEIPVTGTCSSAGSLGHEPDHQVSYACAAGKGRGEVCSLCVLNAVFATALTEV